jgi:hypothetical protein
MLRISKVRIARGGWAFRCPTSKAEPVSRHLEFRRTLLDRANNFHCRVFETGGFIEKSDRPRPGADVLHLAFVLKQRALACLFSGHPPAARVQPIPTEPLGKRLRVFRFGEAEHHNIAVVAPHGILERRRR